MVRSQLPISSYFLMAIVAGTGTLALAARGQMPAAYGAPLQSSPAAEASRLARSDNATSVIIDAKAYDVQRSMSPKILRQDGSEVWGTKAADPDYVNESGIVVYARSVEDARKNKRAGNSPLVITAAGRGKDPSQADVVVGDEDARQILDANKKSHFLDHNNVIFVINN